MDRFVNLTTFSTKGTQFLNKGFKYNIEFHISPNLNILVVDTELALSHYPNNISKKHETATILKKEFLRQNIPRQEIQIIKDIKNKSPGIIFRRADKGNSVVAIDKVDYIQRTDFLNPGKYAVLKCNPTENYPKIFKRTTSNC